jgi:hypothetical protein
MKKEMKVVSVIKQEEIFSLFAIVDGEYLNISLSVDSTFHLMDLLGGALREHFKDAGLRLSADAYTAIPDTKSYVR